MTISVIVLAGLLAVQTGARARNSTPALEVIDLWPGTAPGDVADLGVEHDSTKPGPNGQPEDGVIRLANVSKPTITIYRPERAINTGAAVIVCPGGGYSILAMNLEGTEICQWLTSIGVTAILLKYRVPVRKGRPRFEPPLQDAQRALGIVRQQGAGWGVDPHRVGILGFSAGGHLSAAASTNYETRTYPAVDDADRQNCRPDFTVLIYPAYLTPDADRTRLADEIKVDAKTPPAFVVMTADDPVHMENAMVYTLALKNAHVPVELHLYPNGGHGYGMRPSDKSVSHWPERAAEWLKSQGWLKPKA